METGRLGQKVEPDLFQLGKQHGWEKPWRQQHSGANDFPECRMACHRIGVMAHVDLWCGNGQSTGGLDEFL